MKTKINLKRLIHTFFLLVGSFAFLPSSFAGKVVEGPFSPGNTVLRVTPGLLGGDVEGMNVEYHPENYDADDNKEPMAKVTEKLVANSTVYVTNTTPDETAQLLVESTNLGNTSIRLMNAPVNRQVDPKETRPYNVGTVFGNGNPYGTLVRLSIDHAVLIRAPHAERMLSVNGMERKFDPEVAYRVDLKPGESFQIKIWNQPPHKKLANNDRFLIHLEGQEGLAVGSKQYNAKVGYREKDGAYVQRAVRPGDLVTIISGNNNEFAIHTEYNSGSFFSLYNKYPTGNLSIRFNDESPIDLEPKYIVDVSSKEGQRVGWEDVSAGKQYEVPTGSHTFVNQGATLTFAFFTTVPPAQGFKAAEGGKPVCCNFVALPVDPDDPGDDPVDPVDPQVPDVPDKGIQTDVGIPHFMGGSGGIGCSLNPVKGKNALNLDGMIMLLGILIPAVMGIPRVLVRKALPKGSR